ncbi:MAG: DNA topoisomerase IB [Candidatus Eremiobacteraeota bacterium]|nr:DNA topoisomerase IB [Candidatus Eremiobacteraeota bacterium]
MLPNAPTAVARAAGLRYVDDRRPGIRRKRAGRSFAYYAPDGTKISGKAELARIKSIGVPPAYEDVWICPYENGHIQATARDARGRKQYRYHPRWREVRDETKYERAADFARALPRLRKRVREDLSRQGFPREKVLATIVSLLDATAIRVGNEEYAKTNDSFGLTTLRTGHVRVRGSTLRFKFRGKSGVEHSVALDDARLARIVRRFQDLPGENLFTYVDEDGTSHTVDSQDVNDYLRESAGAEFTAKDFRTWKGTVAAAVALAAKPAAETPRDRKAVVKEALTDVSGLLGNTVAVCRRCYVHPSIVETYLDEGELTLPPGRASAGLDAEEARVLAFLRHGVKTDRRTKVAPLLKRSVRAKAA